MDQNEKAKRKGRPSRYRPALFLILLALTGVGIGVYRLWPNKTPTPYYRLHDFAISESHDQIVFAWRLTPGNRSVVERRSWADFQQGDAESDLLWTTTPDSVWRLAYRPFTDELKSQSEWGQLHAYKTDRIKRQYPSVEWSHLTYSRNGEWLAMASAEAYVFHLGSVDVPVNTPYVSLDVWPYVSDSLALSPTGDRIALVQYPYQPQAALLSTPAATDVPPTGANHSTNPVIKVFSTADLTVLHEFELPESALKLAFHPDGTELAAVMTDNTILLWELATDEKTILTGSFDPLLDQFEYDSSGRWLALRALRPSTIEHQVTVYDLSQAQSEAAPIQLITESHPVRFAFLRDGLLIGEEGNRLTFWQWTGERWENTAEWDIVWD